MRVFLEGLPILSEGKVFGVAIHPGWTQHPGELIEKRQYIEEELQNAVKTLIGKPLLLDHTIQLDGCKVTQARWDEKQHGVYFEAIVSPYVADKIKNGQINKVSISVNPWRKGGGVKFVDGLAPFGFEFDELSLLENLKPGDPQAWVKLMEAMESQEMLIKIMKPNLSDFKEDSFRKVQIDVEQGIEALHAIPKTGDNSYQPVALFFYKLKGWNDQKVQQWLSDNPQYAPANQPSQPTPQSQEIRVT